MVDEEQQSRPSNEARDIGLILASGSPRRRDLLTGAGVAFVIMPSNIPEEEVPGEAPAVFAERLAREKALATARSLAGDFDHPVLGADTIVVLGDEVLGKPNDPEHAVELLSRLVGQTHQVITGVAVVKSQNLETRSLFVSSTVRMRDADEEEIRRYVATGEPLDKAGAYALQGQGRTFVAEVAGSRSNVIGLPMKETLDLLGLPELEGTMP